ncbi:MAG: hypothetical protein ACREQI_03705 [Candidatus Binataceae bacterium]
MKLLRGGITALCLLFLAGCASQVPKNLMQPADNALKLREEQSRRYDTANQTQLLSASAALLQDMGFNIDEINKELGVITASKMRSAVRAGQVTTNILVAALTAAAGSPLILPADKEQKMRAGIVVRPLGDGKSTVVRVTFQRIVWTTQGTVSTQEMLGSDQIYIEFFDKLSKAVFLQAHDL